MSLDIKCPDCYGTLELNISERVTILCEANCGFSQSRFNQPLKTLEAKVEEFEGYNNMWQGQNKEKNKTVQALESQLEALTKCECKIILDGPESNGYKKEYCQGCKNKKLLEGVMRE